MHWQFGEMEFGEMKRNTSNWSNFGMLLRCAGLTASAGLSYIIVNGRLGCYCLPGSNLFTEVYEIAPAGSRSVRIENV